ncbi:MAG: class I SAM-dependent methyltransferase [Phycisphaerae bacterium]
MSNTFKAIFERHDTDKVNNGNYQDGYEASFSSIRHDVKLLFEIGVNRGGSVRAFAEYFPNAVIVGLEIASKYRFDDERIKIEIGDATKPDFINALVEKYGRPDIVIDDGSHFSRDIRASFRLLYPHVKHCYVIEDYGTQFYDYEKGFYINDGTPATSIIHGKINELLSRKGDCRSIHIYNSIGFIFK